MLPSTACRIVNRVIVAVKPIFEAKFIGYVPLIEQRRHGWSFNGEYENVVGIVDASLIETRRPVVDQRTQYSGKHKKHGTKVQVITSCNGLAMSITTGIVGSRHDYAAFRDSGVAEMFAEKCWRGGEQVEICRGVMADGGYQGIQAYIEATIPHRRPRGGELSDDQHEFNRRMSTLRIIVENFFGRLKSYWRILSWYSGSRHHLNNIIVVCSALTNILLIRYPLRSLQLPINTEYMSEELARVERDSELHGWDEVIDVYSSCFSSSGARESVINVVTEDSRHTTLAASEQEHEAMPGQDVPQIDEGTEMGDETSLPQQANRHAQLLPRQTRQARNSAPESREQTSSSSIALRSNSAPFGPMQHLGHSVVSSQTLQTEDAGVPIRFISAQTTRRQ